MTLTTIIRRFSELIGVASKSQLPAEVVYSDGSYADPAWLTSVAGAKVAGDIAGNAASITGTITTSQVAGLDADLAAKQPLDSDLTALAALLFWHFFG